MSESAVRDELSASDEVALRRRIAVMLDAHKAGHIGKEAVVEDLMQIITSIDKGAHGRARVMFR